MRLIEKIKTSRSRKAEAEDGQAVQRRLILEAGARHVFASLCTIIIF